MEVLNNVLKVEITSLGLCQQAILVFLICYGDLSKTEVHQVCNHCVLAEMSGLSDCVPIWIKVCNVLSGKQIDFWPFKCYKILKQHAKLSTHSKTSENRVTTDKNYT